MLENNGLIKKKINNDDISYHLTNKGHSLNKVFYELLLFAINNDTNNEHYNDYEKEELKDMYLEILDLYNKFNDNFTFCFNWSISLHEIPYK